MMTVIASSNQRGAGVGGGGYMPIRDNGYTSEIILKWQVVNSGYSCASS